MNVAGTRGGKTQSAEGFGAAGSRDAGQLRTVIAAAGTLALFLYVIRPILLPFVVAGIIAYICGPLLKWLTKRTGLPRALLAVSLFLVLLSLAALFVDFAGRPLFADTKSIASDLQGTIERLLRQATSDRPIQWLGHSIDPSKIGGTMLDGIRAWFDQPDQLATIASYGIAAIVGTFLTAVLLCYFLVGGPSIARGLLWTVPPRHRHMVAHVAVRLDPLLKRYFLGMVAIVLYAMTASYVGLGLILHINHAPLLALMTGILETIPIVGSTAAAIIAGLISLQTATGPISIAAFALYAVVLRLSIDQIVGPLVLGSAAHLHPVVIIFCLFAGAILFGVPGVILAVPAALAAKTTLAAFYGEDA
jgi:predicted PurR-regulated permease PerM